jgi:hypothetical protein
MKSLLVLILALGSLFIQGCSSAAKDIHFRSRLPTQEAPLVKMPTDFKIGLDADVENTRFNFQPTNNLVTNYNLDNDRIYFSDTSTYVNGIDIDLNLRKMYESLYVKASLSVDYAELQFNPGPLLKLEEPWFVNLNLGFYKTAAFVSTGTEGCTFFCTSSDRSSDLLKEQNIQTSQSGSEKKIGGQVGYRFSDSAIVTLSYQWMDYQVSASVTKAGSPDLRLEEKYYASGYGLGYYFISRTEATLGFSVDQVAMNFRNQLNSQVVGGFHLVLGF